MRTETRLATLSRGGYISDPKVMAAKLFDYWMLSLHSQTTIYAGGVKSLAYALSVGMTDIDSFLTFVDGSISELYGAHYHNVSVKVIDTDGEWNSRVTIRLGVTLYLNDGTDFLLEESIKMNDGVVLLSNYGLDENE